MFRHIKKEFSIVSDRIKSVEFHPSEPMLAVALYNGAIQIFNTNDMSILKTIRVEANKPVRCVRFMPSLHWLIAAGDNLTIYCYDYNTGSLVASMPEAHTDFIRQIAVHPLQPLFLSCSDDNKVKLFRINNNQQITLERTYEKHEHFVMDVKFNPKDPSTFATASLDNTIKFWGLTTSPPRFKLSGHNGGVNCIEFFPGSDCPYIASGSDDNTIKIWDYQTKCCVVTLVGHRENVTALRFHPVYPLLLSTAEDNMLLVWNTTTHETETALDYQKKRGWAIDIKHSQVAVGYDEGLVMLKLGRDSSAVISMDTNGRTYWAKKNQIQFAYLQTTADNGDGQLAEVSYKDAFTSLTYPSTISVNTKNQFVAVCGDNKYDVYSAHGYRLKASGSGREFAWGIDNNFVVREGTDSVQVYMNFAKTPVEVRTPHDCDRVFGGALIGVAGDDAITFYTWGITPQLVRQIDVKAIGVWWSVSGSLVAIATPESLYILQFDENFGSDDEDFDPEVGSANAFSMVTEQECKVKQGVWFNDVFFFNDEQTVSFFAEGHIEVVAHIEKSMLLVGYVSKIERLFLCDNEYNFVSYSIPLAVLDFILSVNDEDELDVSLVPPSWKSKMCAMLETKGLLREAMLLCDNQDKRFELAMKLGDIETAIEIARKTGSVQQYRLLASSAMNSGKVALLEEALEKSGDLSGLLLLESCKGNRKEMRKFAVRAEQSSKNVSFAASFAVGDFNSCINILISDLRYPEAALMARTYAPNRIDECAKLWREFLNNKGEELTAQTIALPSEYPEKFPEIQNNAQNNNNAAEDEIEPLSDENNEENEQQPIQQSSVQQQQQKQQENPIIEEEEDLDNLEIDLNDDEDEEIVQTQQAAEPEANVKKESADKDEEDLEKMLEENGGNGDNGNEDIDAFLDELDDIK